MHSPFYGIDIGDQVIFEIGKQERALTISGKMRHPLRSAACFYDWAFFSRVKKSCEQLAFRPASTPVQIHADHYTPDHARR
jgi:hypothetical protein